MGISKTSQTSPSHPHSTHMLHPLKYIACVGGFCYKPLKAGKSLQPSISAIIGEFRNLSEKRGKRFYVPSAWDELSKEKEGSRRDQHNLVLNYKYTPWVSSLPCKPHAEPSGRASPLSPALFIPLSCHTQLHASTLPSPLRGIPGLCLSSNERGDEAVPLQGNLCSLPRDLP